MAKSKLKLRGRELRRQGMSIKEIANRLSVAQSSASIWCRDIELSQSQLRKLEEKQRKGSYIGRVKGAATQKRKRVNEVEALREQGIKEISKLSEREFFTAGIALYWGEGLKTGGITGIVNSDPKVIVFMMAWFTKFCGVKAEDFICRIGINKMHKNRLSEVEKYWSKITKLPLKQFTKTGLYKSASKKQYENQSEHFGTLRVKIRRGTKIQRKILGWIEGLYLAV